MWQTKEELLELTLELVKIKSVSSTKDEYNVAKFVYENLLQLNYFKQNPNHLFLKPINDDLDRYYVCALVKSKKETDRTLLTISHIDTADIENAGYLKEFILDPYTYTNKLKENMHLLDEDSIKDLLSGEYLFGRGIMDMKMGLAMQMSLLERYSINDNFEGNLLLVAVPDEESNSMGAINSIPFINYLLGEHKLSPIAVLNSEPDFGAYPGDDNKYVYLGTCGKLLLGLFIVGKEVHVGESLAGLNPNLIGAEILSNLDLNTELCEKVGNEITMPPTCLKYEDTKKYYNIQMPPSSIMYYNLQTLNSNPKIIIEKIRGICSKSVDSVVNKINVSKNNYEKLSNTKIKYPGLSIKVYTYHELYEKLIGQYGDKLVNHLSEKIDYWSKDKSIDERDITTKIVAELCDFAKGEGPIIVIFFAPPYYPHIGPDNNDICNRKIIEAINEMISYSKEKYDIELNIQKYFKGLSDLSYFALQDGDEVLKYLKPNMPILGHKYVIPFEEIKKINLPVLNYGPHGKDPHKFTERILIDYSFDIVPKLVRKLVEQIITM